MIDISDKKSIIRIAKAIGTIKLKRETITLIKKNQIKKGDVFTIARISGINAVKKVPELIPLCHPIPITNVNIEFDYLDEESIEVTATVKSIAKTGVEMEALMGVSAAILNIWDVVKMYEKDKDGLYPETAIKEIKVIEKIKQNDFTKL